MSTSIVEPALRTSYHLAGADATRLRRLTTRSGLEAENILSRLAIVSSLRAGPSGAHANFRLSSAEKRKEIRGSVLLGRAPQAALILAMIARSSDTDFVDLKAAITWHWGRGLRLLDDASSGGDVVRWMAAQIEQTERADVDPRRRAQRAGLSSSRRDEAAAAVGRHFPSWSTEVKRLVAMAARLDPGHVDVVAQRVAAGAERRASGQKLTEALALRILQEEWGINRLGLTVADRSALSKVLAGDPLAPSDNSVGFLSSLGLVEVSGTEVQATPLGRRLGEEAVHP